MPRSASETRATDATIRIIDREKELDNDKYCTVGGMKLWKNPEAPYTIFYAHCWLGKTFTEWKCTYDTYVRGSTVTEIHIHRQRCCEQLLMTWFDMTKTVTRIEDLTPANVKMFQTVIELLAEGYLLRKGISLTGTATAATQTLSLSLEKRRHDGKGLDYFSDLAEARSGRGSRNSHGHL